MGEGRAWTPAGGAVYFLRRDGADTAVAVSPRVSFARVVLAFSEESAHAEPH